MFFTVYAGNEGFMQKFFISISQTFYYPAIYVIMLSTSIHYIT